MILTRADLGWTGLRAHVFARDQNRCQAPVLDPGVHAQDCRTKFGQAAVIAWRYDGTPIYREDSLTLDHVHLHAGGTKGKKAPDDEAHLVTLCWRHHMDGWATSKLGRSLERAYLTSRYEEGDDDRSADTTPTGSAVPPQGAAARGGDSGP